MPDFQNHPFFANLTWLSRYTRFPACRLAPQAERLLLLAAAAQMDELSEKATKPSFMIQSRDGALEASQRARAERRKLVHFKCDNSAKV